MIISDDLVVNSSDNKNMNYFYIFCSIYVTSILCAMTVSARIINLSIPFTTHSFLITGGTLIIPIAFFSQDIITEIFGFCKAKQTLFISMILVSFFVGYIFIITLLPCTSNNQTCDAYYNLGISLPRHLFAFLASFSFGIATNNLILSKLKKYLKGKHLAFRFIFSTAVGEIALQFIGTTFAWFGNMNSASCKIRCDKKNSKG